MTDNTDKIARARTYTLTPRQREAWVLLEDPRYRRYLFDGGARSPRTSGGASPPSWTRSPRSSRPPTPPRPPRPSRTPCWPPSSTEPSRRISGGGVPRPTGRLGATRAVRRLEGRAPPQGRPREVRRQDVRPDGRGHPELQRQEDPRQPGRLLRRAAGEDGQAGERKDAFQQKAPHPHPAHSKGVETVPEGQGPEAGHAREVHRSQWWEAAA